MACTQMH